MSGDIIRWLRTGALLVTALTVAATAVEVRRERNEPASVVPIPTVRDPLAAELKRCNAMTPAQGRDDTCERTWAENRRRFLGLARQPPLTSSHGTDSSALTGNPR